MSIRRMIRTPEGTGSTSTSPTATEAEQRSMR
ncbi:hypothetical protein FHW96_001632 [Novosphingobium sp. SG751A]|nr:hypothetical protein [Novosphingobium sp. SG751A]